MNVSLRKEFARLTGPHRKIKPQSRRELAVINAAIWARDYGSKSLIPFFGLYYGIGALVACFIALSLNFFRRHPVRRPAAIGGVLGVFGFCASMVWLIDD